MNAASLTDIADATRAFVRRRHGFFIDGRWGAADGRERFGVSDPATEAPLGDIALGTAADIDAAVHSARRALQGPWA
jgi:phenylacetaldehyde dehydrogenase